MIELRHYQQAAKDAVYRHLRMRDDNPVIVIPTGGGKTPLIASISQDAVQQWGGRVLVMAHVKELLQQAADKLGNMCPGVGVGLYSAGLSKKELDKPVTVAGVQSIYRHACELGKIDLILIDECHLIPPDGDGMYRTFLRECQVVNPRVRVVGLTATPFRTATGPVCSDDHFLNAICYEVSVRQLISEGFLSPIVAKAGQGVSIDFAAIAKRGVEFDATASEQAFDKDEITSAAVGEILSMTSDRRSVLIFATGVKHAEHIRKAIEASGQECGIVTGSTPSSDRAELLARFKGEKLGMLARPPLKFLVNVNVLTTGFDAPNVDCVVLLRPTMSAGLYYQMVGRGFRLAPGKADCLVLDYGDNARRHGPVDKLQIKSPGSRGGGGEAPGKECPTCHSVIFSGYAVCPDCGHEFPQSDNDKLGHTSAGVPVLSGVVEDEEHEVESVEYAVHRKRGAPDDAPKTLRVIYRFNAWDSISEWICIEHTGWAQQQAKKWWASRSAHDFPYDADYAVKLANAGALAHPVKVFTRKISGEQWPKVLRVECEEIPPKSLTVPDLNTEEVPF